VSAEEVRLRKREKGDRKLTRAEKKARFYEAAEDKQEEEADRRYEAAILAEALRKQSRR
jgi:hypothetical protein